MYAVELVILLAGLMLLVAVASSKLSLKVGVPGLVLFMGIGMLVGEAGPGGVPFDDYPLAHAAGTLALVLILFDGGLQTSVSALRDAWRPAAVLSTAGVMVTSLVTGLLAVWLLDLPLLVGLLLGAVVGSTDAAAVFAVLRGQGLHLRPRLTATLEVESGSNDPMAVLLTLGILGILAGDLELGWPLVTFFLQQAVVGTAMGLLVGAGGSWLLNRVELDAAGLYPVLTFGLAMVAFGAPAYLGGSGFLAVYLAGCVLGNSRVVFQRGIFLAHDGGAWMAQMGMFMLLGLLASPSRLLDVGAEGTLLALGLIVVARPAAVLLTLLPFRFPLRELLFLSWGGLKGAIPIILAIYPLLRGIPEGILLFDLVFFVVLLSALAQGWTLPIAARWLKVEEEPEPRAPVTLEITSLRHVDGDIVDYRLDPGAKAANRQVRELALPENAVIAMVSRGKEIIPPRGTTVLRPGDHVFVVLHPSVRKRVDRLFAQRAEELAREAVELEFPIRGDTRVGEVEEFYAIHLDPDPERSVGDVVAQRLGAGLVEGAEIVAGEVRLSAREVQSGRVTQVGVEILGPSGKGGREGGAVPPGGAP